MTTPHWTERSTADAMFKVGADFVRQIEPPATQTRSRLAQVLGVSRGRVSQVLNNPGNLTLRKMIEYAKALQKRIAIVAYDDTDTSQAPISGEVFVACWERAGRPRDFFDLKEADSESRSFHFDVTVVQITATTGFLRPGLFDVADTALGEDSNVVQSTS
jgi:transcriptional regulator with XRE-family HTH domain